MNEKVHEVYISREIEDFVESQLCKLRTVRYFDRVCATFFFFFVYGLMNDTTLSLNIGTCFTLIFNQSVPHIYGQSGKYSQVFLN